MGGVWDVVSSVQDAVDATKDARRRKPIGFWRATVATLGVVWTVVGILPGIPAMLSIDRWMKGKSRRPVVAMAMGLVLVGLLAALVVSIPFGFLPEGREGATALRIVRGALAGGAALMVLWFLGRYLFRPLDEGESAAAAAGPRDAQAPPMTSEPSTAVPVGPPPTSGADLSALDRQELAQSVAAAPNELQELARMSDRLGMLVLLPFHTRRIVTHLLHPREAHREAATTLLLREASPELRRWVVSVLGAVGQPARPALVAIAQEDPLQEEREVPDPLNASMDYYDREREVIFPIRVEASAALERLDSTLSTAAPDHEPPDAPAPAAEGAPTPVPERAGGSPAAATQPAAAVAPAAAEPLTVDDTRVVELKGKGDVTELGRLMLDPDPWVRVEAADALAELGDPAAFDALIESIGTPCRGEWADRARGAARFAMSRLGPPSSTQLKRLVEVGGAGPWEAIELVRQHGLADDPEVGLWYRAATGEWDGADATQPGALALIVANLESPSHRLAAIEGLRAAGAAGIPHLVAIVERDQPHLPDLFGPSAEKNAYEALCAIDEPAAREAVANQFARIAAGPVDDKVRRCRDGLVRAGGEPALRALLSELEDPRPARRVAAAEALGRLGDPRAVPGLEAALTDDHRVVTMLEQAPDNLSDEFPREAMQRIDERFPVRETAAAAIARLRPGPDAVAASGAAH